MRIQSARIPATSPPPLSRRGALIALAGLAGSALAGCDSSDGGKTDTARPHPLAEHLRTATELARAYEAAFAADSGLAGGYGTLRDNHWAHADALATATHEPAPDRTSPPAALSTAPPTRATLLAAEEEAHRSAYAAALTIPGTYTALLGPIVACRATHLEVLR